MSLQSEQHQIAIENGQVRHLAQLLLDGEQRLAVAEDGTVPVGERDRMAHECARPLLQLHVPLAYDVLHCLALSNDTPALTSSFCSILTAIVNSISSLVLAEQ